MTDGLDEVLAGRRLATLFQPIYAFGESRILGFEALVRGPQGSRLETPFELFAAAGREGRLVELNIVCIQEVLRAFARASLPGTLFLNISPHLIVQRGFDQARAARFLEALGVEPARVVIEVTEDAGFEFGLVRESLALYRAMGFRVAIDDLGEGFASLRLWSELGPEFVKADKHFVRGVADDPVKLQFLRAIQHMAEASGARVVAEGIETRDDFHAVRSLGVAYGQGWFIGRPQACPPAHPSPAAREAQADTRVRVAAPSRGRAPPALRAKDFACDVEALDPSARLEAAHGRFAASPALSSIPVIAGESVHGVVSRAGVEALAAAGFDLRRECRDHLCASPLRADAELDLAGLVALLLEADARRLADGFVVLSQGRYAGMGRSQDVLRSLHAAQALAARHVHPLSALPGLVPLHEHLDTLLARRVAFTAWTAHLDEMASLNDAAGFRCGDALLHATARLLESCVDPEVDLVAHAAGARFVVLAQSGDWRRRAERAVAGFREVLKAHVAPGDFERGYYAADSREGRRVRPLPRLALGVVPVLPGVFDSRHGVLACAKAASRQAARGASSALHVDERHANAYPASVLLESGEA